MIPAHFEWVLLVFSENLVASEIADKLKTGLLKVDRVSSSGCSALATSHLGTHRFLCLLSSLLLNIVTLIIKAVLKK